MTAGHNLLLRFRLINSTEFLPRRHGLHPSAVRSEIVAKKVLLGQVSLRLGLLRLSQATVVLPVTGLPLSTTDGRYV